MSDTATQATGTLDADAKRLAELGYKQDLDRSWSGFSNFAISFSVVSVITGGLASYGLGLANGGPITMAYGWPLVSIMVLFVGLAMAELASAYPTSGGLYWWASKLGKPVHGWFAGWFNLVGQIAVTASIDYGAAVFVTAVLEAIGAGIGTSRDTIFLVFTSILVLQAALNVAGPQLAARINNISVWWHLIGGAIIVLVLIFAPDDHQSIKFVFTETVDNSGVGFGGVAFSFLLGLLHAQYTLTGYDASAHLSEETKAASTAAAKGIINTIIYSAIGGYILILAVTFAMPSLEQELKVFGEGGYPVIDIFQSTMSSTLSSMLLIIAAVAQLFCGYASTTASSRMMYAFSRDGAVPGSRLWSKLTSRHVPANAVAVIVVFAWLLLVPSMLVPEEKSFVAYFAATSVAVIALYISYGIPIYLRLRAGDDFEAGEWSLGGKYKIVGTIAVLWIAFISVLFMIPTADAGLPWNKDFTWDLVNYAPLTLGGSILIVGLWWVLSARKWFTGPKRTLAEIDAELDLEPGVSP